MLYFFLGFFLIIIQLFVTFTTNFNIWPELYFFSWLVQKGLVPYRDFFDHHGFLLYYLLSPFSNGANFSAFKIIYAFVLSCNLMLVLAIIKKFTRMSGFIIGGILTIFLNFFVGENNFWYETVITTFYLLVCFLLITKSFRYKTYTIGILISLASFIKPTAGLVLFPLLLIKKDVRIIIAFVFCWLIALFYFFINGAFSQFFEGLFLFNEFLVKFYRPTFFSDWKFLFSSVILLFFSIFLSRKSKKKKNYLVLLSFLIASLVFLSSGYDKTRIMPVFAFFSILAVIPIGYRYRYTWQKSVFVSLLIVYMVFLGIKVFSHRVYLNSRRMSWQDDLRVKKAAVFIKRLKARDDKIYIFSNHPEIYMELDQLPPTYFPLKFPLTERYFSNYEKRLIEDLVKNKVLYIVIPKPEEEEYLILRDLKKFTTEKYSLIENNGQLEIRSYSN